MKTFTFRFDIDSLADIEVGVPQLIGLGKELNARFSFFVNMGRSFNIRVQWSRMLQRYQKPGATGNQNLTTLIKLGFWRSVRTVIYNPNIGLSHAKTLFKLLDEGHELGLHGGMDHPLWQWNLEGLRKGEISDLLKPAYDHFTRLFGRPKGFSSPGFRYNRHVLELVDEYGFTYASDMEGEGPCRIEGFRHVQIPVNIIGPDKVPLLEHLGRTGTAAAEDRVAEEVEKREHAVLYGHPAYEGTDARLRQIISRIMKSGHRIVTLEELSVQ